MGGKFSRVSTGVVLIILGALALLGNLGFADIFGEGIVAIIGIVFLALYYLGRTSWAIFPGAFTAPVGVVIFLAARGLDMDAWWPLFIAAPGLSFLLIRFSAPGNDWAIFPGSILVLIAGVMFSFSSHLLSWAYVGLVGKIWPVVLILIGLWLVFRSLKRDGAPPR